MTFFSSVDANEKNYVIIELVIFMQRYFIKNEQIKDGYATLEGSDFHHISHVMRYRVGTQIVVVDETHTAYSATIQHYQKDSVSVMLTQKLPDQDWHLRLSLGQVMIKKDRFEMILQKATELGVTSIYPLDSDYAIVKLHDVEKKTKRYETIVKEAAEQTERLSIPTIHDYQTIYDLPFADYDHVLVAYARQEEQNLNQTLGEIKDDASVLLLIGPEGGFSPKEIDFLSSKARLVSLGKTILRSETAAIYSLSVFRFIRSQSS